MQGARQVGKTTLLTQFAKGFFREVYYFNFEKDQKSHSFFEQSLDPHQIIKAIEYHFNRPINQQHDLLIFDEIQACPRALASLKYFAEDMPQLAVCAAGSLLGIEFGPVSFPVGKVDTMTLYPMSFEEFLLAMEEQLVLNLLQNINLHDTIPETAHQRLFEQLTHYFIVGGLPAAVKTFQKERNSMVSAFKKVRAAQEVLIQHYYADIAKHSGKVNAMHIARVWQSSACQLAESQDRAKKFTFTNVVPGIDRYSRLVSAIDWLEACKLIIKVPICNSGNLPFSAYTQENTFKLYLFDVGILGAMSNLSPQTILTYDYGSYKGYFAENFVAEAFLAGGFHHLISWQEKQAEVEFLYETDGNAIPLEVKSGNITHSKSAKIFAEKYHSPYRVIFSANTLSYSPEVHRYPLYLAGRFPLEKA